MAGSMETVSNQKMLKLKEARISFAHTSNKLLHCIDDLLHESDTNAETKIDSLEHVAAADLSLSLRNYIDRHEPVYK